MLRVQDVDLQNQKNSWIPRSRSSLVLSDDLHYAHSTEGAQHTQVTNLDMKLPLKEKAKGSYVGLGFKSTHPRMLAEKHRHAALWNLQNLKHTNYVQI